MQCVDILTPMARGSALLMVGDHPQGMTQLALDAISNLHSSDVFCVYAAIGCSEAALEHRLQVLQDNGAMGYTTVVAATGGATTLGKQYAAMCTAISAGEAVRNEGGDALVVLDCVESMLTVWESMARHVFWCEKQARSDDEATSSEGMHRALQQIVFQGDVKTLVMCFDPRNMFTTNVQ